jgi:hypothetical protein
MPGAGWRRPAIRQAADFHRLAANFGHFLKRAPIPRSVVQAAFFGMLFTRIRDACGPIVRWPGVPLQGPAAFGRSGLDLAAFPFFYFICYFSALQAGAPPLGRDGDFPMEERR